jgi:hypothetical protein
MTTIPYDLAYELAHAARDLGNRDYGAGSDEFAEFVKTLPEAVITEARVVHHMLNSSPEGVRIFDLLGQRALYDVLWGKSVSPGFYMDDAPDYPKQYMHLLAHVPVTMVLAFLLLYSCSYPGTALRHIVEERGAP